MNRRKFLTSVIGMFAVGVVNPTFLFSGAHPQQLVTGDVCFTLAKENSAFRMAMLDDFSERFVKPAAQTLANQFDAILYEELMKSGLNER